MNRTRKAQRLIETISKEFLKKRVDAAVAAAPNTTATGNGLRTLISRHDTPADAARRTGIVAGRHRWRRLSTFRASQRRKRRPGSKSVPGPERYVRETVAMCSERMQRTYLGVVSVSPITGGFGWMGRMDIQHA